MWILVKERTGTSIIMDAIRSVYFNPLTSSPDRGKLLAAVRLVDPSVTREQLDDWLETEREQTLAKVYYNPILATSAA